MESEGPVEHDDPSRVGDRGEQTVGEPDTAESPRPVDHGVGERCGGIGAAPGRSGDGAVTEVDPESLFYASVHHAVMGRDEIAIDLLRRLLEVDSQHFEARWRLASLLYDQGLYQESVMHYRMANQINPLDLSVRRMLGFALLRNQQTREAELAFLDYLQSVPEDEVIASELERLRVRDED